MDMILPLTRTRHALAAPLLLCLLTATPTPVVAAEAPATAAEHVVHDLEETVARMQPLVARYGYAGVVGAISVEGFGLPAPGQTLMMAAALESAHGHLHIGLLLAMAVLAAVAGNSLGYLLGRLGGRPLLRKLKVNEAHEAKIEALFERYGGGIIVLARFFDGPRQLNGIVAGTLEMRWWVFTAFNVIGAILWVGVWGLGTYYLSEHVRTIEALIRRINPWVLGIALLALLALLVYLFRGRRDKPPAPRPGDRA